MSVQVKCDMCEEVIEMADGRTYDSTESNIQVRINEPKKDFRTYDICPLCLKSVEEVLKVKDINK